MAKTCELKQKIIDNTSLDIENALEKTTVDTFFRITEGLGCLKDAPKQLTYDCCKDINELLGEYLQKIGIDSEKVFATVPNLVGKNENIA